MAKAEITATHTVHDGWATFLVATVRLASGEIVRREIEDHGAAIAVLPYDPARRVALLVRQLRVPPLHAGGVQEIMEVPAGLLDEADAEAGARREALEEVGVRLGALRRVATVWSMPGISTEQMHLFLAPFDATDRVAAGGGLDHEHEHITVLEVPLAELADALAAGRIDDMKTLALVQALRLAEPSLFEG
jgi:nudix-type nucleoside diphosphatase (YffH/AdpP family)